MGYRSHVPAVGPFTWERRWVDLLAPASAQEVREPHVPEPVRPDAYIEWGEASNFFTEAFREEAKNPRSVAKPTNILNGTMRGEYRKLQKVTITNPMDSGQKIDAFRTSEAGFTYPVKDKETGLYPEVVFSFRYDGQDQYPVYFNIRGERVLPVVMGPLEEIIDVHWGGFYVIFSAMSIETHHSLVVELLTPPTYESNDSGSDFITGAMNHTYEKESTEENPGDQTIHHAAKWMFEGRGKVTAQRIPGGSWGTTPGEEGLDHVYEQGSFLLYDTERVPNPSHPLLQGQPNLEPPISYRLDTDYGCIVTVTDEYIAGGDPGYVVHYKENRLAQPQTNYGNYWHYADPGAPGGSNIDYFPRKIFVYRPWLGEWNERYFQPWAVSAVAVDISKILQHYKSYWGVGQSTFSVLVSVTVEAEAKEGTNPSCSLRYGLYRGRMAAEDSAKTALGDLPKDIEEDRGAVWNWVLEPTLIAAANLRDTESQSLGKVSGTKSVHFTWDLMSGRAGFV